MQGELVVCSNKSVKQKKNQSIFFVNLRKMCVNAIHHELWRSSTTIFDIGVLGDGKWKKLARLPNKVIDAFNASVTKNMLP